MLHNSNSRGFTIAEIVVVIAVISLISSIIAVNASKSRSLARDGQRVSDLTAIQNALNLYFADNKKYPAAINTGLISLYISQVPKDPNGSDYKYAGIDNSSPASSDTCESYHLGAVMENAGNSGLGQDTDLNILGNLCAGSGADFYGISTACGPSTASPDLCFDLAP